MIDHWTWGTLFKFQPDKITRNLPRHGSLLHFFQNEFSIFSKATKNSGANGFHDAWSTTSSCCPSGSASGCWAPGLWADPWAKAGGSCSQLRQPCWATSQAKWWCPKIGVHPNHIHFNGIVPYKPSIWGYPHFRKPPNVDVRYFYHGLWWIVQAVLSGFVCRIHVRMSGPLGRRWLSLWEKIASSLHPTFQWYFQSWQFFPQLLKVHRVLFCSYRLLSSLDVHYQLHPLPALERVLGTGEELRCF